MDLDLILPVYNEERNLVPITEEIRDVFSTEPLTYRILFVDDGSTDSSGEILRELCGEYSFVSSVHFASNCGQSAAFTAGFEQARGDVIATMDADGQNDPADIPGMLNDLNDVDVVVGYRRQRKDSIWKKIGSRVANTVRNWVTGDDIIDTGCSVKIFRREVVRSLRMFKGMHRFLPTLARMHGFDVKQVPVNHRSRWEGETKYSNLGRLKTTVADLLAVRWMQSRVIQFDIKETNNLDD